MRLSKQEVEQEVELPLTCCVVEHDTMRPDACCQQKKKKKEDVKQKERGSTFVNRTENRSGRIARRARPRRRSPLLFSAFTEWAGR